MRKIALALLFALLPSLAGAQQFPVIQDQSVIGRVGNPGHDGGSGPSQAIPFLNLNSLLGNHVLPGTYASDPQFGMKCNGVDDDSAALQLAVNTADANMAWPVYVPSGTCPIAKNVFLNKTSGPGILTVPGMKLVGQGRGVTILDTRVANDYAISVNPAWKAAHQALFGIAAQTVGGTLATNTYYVQISVQGPAGEIFVTLPKSIAVTGSTGSISITLPPITQGYGYNLRLDTASTPAHYALVSGGNAFNLGGGQTVTMTALGFANGAVPQTINAAWQEASISNLSITNATGATNASGIEYFKCGYCDVTDVYMHGLTGDGFGIQAYSGDIDGSFDVAIHSSKFDTINGTCVNAAGNVLELSNFTVDDRTEFNACGTVPPNLNAPVTISAISNSSSSQVTTSGSHNLLPHDQIAFSVSGVTLANTWYRVCGVVTGNTFNLCDTNGNQINTTSLGSFTGGTVSLSWRPPQIAGGVITGGGGCIAWTGLIGTFKNIDFTQCNNFAMYFTEAGTSDNPSIENVDFENTAGVGLYITGVSGGTLKNFECLSTVGDGSTVSCVQLGTGFATGGVSNFLIDVGKVRTNVTPSVGFVQLQNTSIGATYQDTNRVRNITWQTFDATGQTRFSGFVFDPIPGQVLASISAQNTVKLVPVGQGACLPLHPKSPGEWVCYHVPSAGITGTVTGGLSTNTSYNCYAYNSAATAFPYSISFACNSDATALNEGYAVDSTDGTKTYILSATTDGSGNFQTSGAQTSQYPPGGGVTTAAGSVGQLVKYTGASALGPAATGTGVLTALGVNVGTAGSPVVNGSAGGIPSSITLTNGTGLPISTGVANLGANVAAFLTTPSSLNLLTMITSSTGTGNLVFNTSPAFVTPNLGTPSAAVLTSATGLPISTGLTGAGTGVLAALAVNTGTAGSHVVNGGALGTPSSGIGTNLTGIPTTGLTGALQAAQEPAHTGDMTNTAGSLATTVVAINGVNQTTSWTSYTPTVTSASGTITTASATGRYKQIGKTIFLQISATVTTAGSGASALLATLPFTASAFGFSGSTRETAISGTPGIAFITPSGTTVAALSSVGSTYIANGANVVYGITYEVP